MALIFWWMLLVWLVIAGASVAVRIIGTRRGWWKSDRRGVVLAHTRKMTVLPAYKEALKRYKRLVVATAVCIILAMVSGVILSARPATVSITTPGTKSRDVMLCLDVSGSVLNVDYAVVKRFQNLVSSFDEQRFAMTVFNSSAYVVLPLSDDYPYIQQQLTQQVTALEQQKGQAFTDLTSGTLADFEQGTSLVGEGLAACVDGLGDQTAERSRSIILATDNEINGSSIISLEKATDAAANQNIRVYAIDPGSQEQDRQADHQALENAVAKTGGSYYDLDDSQAIRSIIDQISSQEAQYAVGAPSLSKRDIPLPFLLVLLITVPAYLAFVWRLKL